MSDQGSTYPVLQDVPVMVSALYKLPKQVFVGSELTALPDNVLENLYPFTLEKEALSEIEAAQGQQTLEEQKLASWQREYKDEKMRKQKLAARKIAPGFLDTDTRILKPEPLYSPEAHEEDETGSSLSPAGVTATTATTTIAAAAAAAGGSSPAAPVDLDKKGIDYLRFDPGIPPPDPWDAPENDLAALTSILGGNDAATVAAAHAAQAVQKRASVPHDPPTYWQQQQQQQTVQQPLQQHASRHSSPPVAMLAKAPALPPKPFSPSSSQPSSPPSQSSPLLPPRPPPPATAAANNNGNVDILIQELVNMGFSKPQATDALEKNENDLTKATNFLLDHGSN
ncbi:hypothetical protein BCR43DRAFT_522191 [Syncephalastrum racemosum]|uniref:UBA domain-containing protein n=1 Tax=Syncephalastrum racemosum TaxID=13706 RepID=A0A1X2HPP8_SYNRA|nr:hypothetical protein BCR43DRAFT_522191 [Syncephalastrum racemosum]